MNSLQHRYLSTMNNEKIRSEIEYNPQAFNQRYAIYLPSHINLSCIDQLNHDLGAINPLLTKTFKGGIYLTADKFKNLTFLIEKARVLGNVDKYDDDNSCELIYIDHWLFTEVSYHF